MPEVPQYDTIMMNFAALCEAALGPRLDALCECVQSYSQNPGVQPCDAFPFNYNRSIVQTTVCHVATTVMQVPKGMTGVITRISFQERYPGTLYGANFMLMINDNLSPWFPRVDSPLGDNLGSGIGTRICLEEQDMVSVLLQCSWQPVVYVGQASTDQQTIFPFQLSGYYQPKQISEVIE